MTARGLGSPVQAAIITGVAAAVLYWAGAWARAGAAPAVQTADSPVLRVGILVDRPSVEITADGPVAVEDVSMHATRVPAALTPPSGATAWTVAAGATGGLDLSGASLGPAVRLTPRQGLLRADGRPYRGVLELRRTQDGHVTVVNVIDLESYLYGVIKAEIDPRWPREAVRAQAIAARTLAWQRMAAARPPAPGPAGADAGFDLPATTDAQRYLGASAEDPAATAAVDATRGLVAAYDHRPIFAAYHANSGGHTEDSENVWGSPYPYLRGVADPYALEAPGVSWSAAVPLVTIESDLRRGGMDVAGLADVAAGRTTAWGRVLAVVLRDGAGRVHELNANRFRLLVGPGVVRSTMVSVTRRGGEVLFAGRGSGHGVGLDQWGARAMATRGFSYEEILKYYYTGVAIEPHH